MIGLGTPRLSVAILLLTSWGGSAATAQPTPLDPADFRVDPGEGGWTPDVGSDAVGNFVVGYKPFEEEYSYGPARTVVRRFRADATPIDRGELVVNTDTSVEGYHPALSVDPEGGFVVVWATWPGSPGDPDWSIIGRRFGADGAPLDATEFLVDTTTAGYEATPEIGQDDEGNFVVAWLGSYVPGHPQAEVRARRFRADGAALDASDFRADTLSALRSGDVGIAVQPTGGFLVVWSSPVSRGSDGDGSSIQARLYRADGTPVDAQEFQVNTETQGNQTAPKVAADPAGGFVVVWNSGDQDRARRLAPDGAPLDPEDFQVSGDSAVAYDQPAVARDAAGGFWVTYSKDDASGGDDDGLSLWGRRFRSDGTPVDAGEFQVNTYTTRSQAVSRVAIEPSGDVVVAWESARGGVPHTAYSTVHARRFGRPTIEVTSISGGTGGPGCTLRDAITAADTGQPTGGCPAGNEGGVVLLPQASTISLTEPDNGINGLPVIRRSVTIRGRESRIERDAGLACPQPPEFRIFEVVDGGILTLEDLTVSNGCVSNSAGIGGGILASGGTVVLRRTFLEGNASASAGGGLAQLGGNLLVFDSTVRGNRAGSAGGGIAVTGAPGWLRLERSTVAGNTAASGGGVSSTSSTPLLARVSTFSGNVATSAGGGLDVAGSAASLLDASTVTGNSAPEGAGVRFGAAGLALHGSLVGDDLGGAECASRGGTVDGSGLNLDTDGSCAALASGNVATVPSLELGPLADNGGSSPTHLPLAGSPALDAAPECTYRSGAALALDQRGEPRPTDDDGDGMPACDLGAVERGPVFLDGFESGDAGRWSEVSP